MPVVRYYGNCSFEGCPQTATYKAKRLCPGHYSQFKNGRELAPLRYVKKGLDQICKYPQCGRPTKSKELCGGHYRQIEQGRELSPLKRAKEKAPCSFAGCKYLVSNHKTRLCAAHNRQFKHGQLRELGPTASERASLVCSEPLCENPVSVLATMLCVTHDSQLRKNGSTAPIDKTRGDRSTWLPCLRPLCQNVRNPNKSTCNKCRETANRFGLRHEDYLDLYANGSVCQSCGLEGKCQIDHDHSCCEEAGRSCGKCVRGLLCSTCNWVMGQVNDDTKRLEAMVAYLKKTSL